jgi:hypothetical protein
MLPNLATGTEISLAPTPQFYTHTLQYLPSWVMFTVHTRKYTMGGTKESESFGDGIRMPEITHDFVFSVNYCSRTHHKSNFCPAD